MFQLETPDEIVLTVSPDNLPWFINIIISKISSKVNFKWHIHSSVPTEKVTKVKAFVKNLQSTEDSKVTIRLIFKCGKDQISTKTLLLHINLKCNLFIVLYQLFN